MRFALILVRVDLTNDDPRLDLTHACTNHTQPEIFDPTIAHRLRYIVARLAGLASVSSPCQSHHHGADLRGSTHRPASWISDVRDAMGRG